MMCFRRRCDECATTFDRHYAFRGHSWVPSKHRDWKHRQDALHKEMSKFSADFLCLQEAELRDLDKDFVEPLSTSGYKHVTADPKGGHDHTKPVIFYNSSRFELLWCKPKSRAVVAHFKEITSDNSLIIASCHLQGGQQAPTRYTQGRSILKAIDHRMRSLDPGSPRARSASSSRSPGRKRGKRDSSSRDDSSSNNEESSQAIGHVSRPKESETTPPRPACIICGDFNAYRDDPSIRLFKAGRFSKKDWIIDDGEPPRRIDFSAPMVGGLADAYSVMDLKGEEGTRPYTFQWGAMMTENKVHRMIIDYILHTPPPPPPSPSSPPLDSKGASSSAKSFKAKRSRQQDVLHNRSGLKLRALRTPLGPRRRKEMARNGVNNSEKAWPFFARVSLSNNDYTEEDTKSKN